MSQQDAPIPVTGPVTATVGPVWLGLFPPKTTEWNGDPDAYDEGLPWAWCAITHVTFRFGRRQTTKKVTARHRYELDDDRPDDEAAEVGRLAVLEDIRKQLASHGFEPPELQIMKADPAPVRAASTEVGPW